MYFHYNLQGKLETILKRFYLFRRKPMFGEKCASSLSKDLFGIRIHEFAHRSI